MQQQQYSPSDFLFGPSLGEGRFSTVAYAELKQTPERDGAYGASPPRQNHEHRQRRGYAIKIIPKSEILRRNLIHAVMTEKHILSGILPDSELFMKLFMCFHDASYLYFVLELCAGGTLLDLMELRSLDKTDGDSPVMDVSRVRHYSGQIVRAVEFLHQRGVVHRDISPRNVGLTAPGGEVKLGDFGSAAVFVREQCEGAAKLRRWMPEGAALPGAENANDFVGTADYVSPEMIRGNGGGEDQSGDLSYLPSMDLWSLGCIVFHMTVGRSPFHAESDSLALQKVLDYANDKSPLNFPSWCTDKDLKDMASSLLSVNPSNRLGAKDEVFCRVNNRYKSIRGHSFFEAYNCSVFWASMETRTFDPPQPPKEPKWMADLLEGKVTLRPIESVHFDL